MVAGTVTANVNVEGRPELRVAGGVMVSVGAAATLTVTEPEAVPVVAGVVGVVGAPVAGGVVGVLDPACAPTAAVTVATLVVFRTVAAAPF